MKRGFTVVELLITLVVIGILLGLGTVGLRSTLANGRDSERKSDAETIARGLEMRYKRGNQEFKAATGFSEAGTKSMLASYSYPSVLEYKYGVGLPKGEFDPSTNAGGKDTMYRLWGFNNSSATSPSGLELAVVCSTSCQPAENASQISAAFASPNKDRYVYEPIDENGAVCDAADYVYLPCPRFNLYWISEVDTTTYLGIAGLKVIRSQH